MFFESSKKASLYSNSRRKPKSHGSVSHMYIAGGILAGFALFLFSMAASWVWWEIVNSANPVSKLQKCLPGSDDKCLWDWWVYVQAGHLEKLPIKECIDVLQEVIQDHNRPKNAGFALHAIAGFLLSMTDETVEAEHQFRRAFGGMLHTLSVDEMPEKFFHYIFPGAQYNLLPLDAFTAAEMGEHHLRADSHRPFELIYNSLRQWLRFALDEHEQFNLQLMLAFVYISDPAKHDLLPALTRNLGRTAVNYGRMYDAERCRLLGAFITELHHKKGQGLRNAKHHVLLTAIPGLLKDFQGRVFALGQSLAKARSDVHVWAEVHDSLNRHCDMVVKRQAIYSSPEVSRLVVGCIMKSGVIEEMLQLGAITDAPMDGTSLHWSAVAGAARFIDQFIESGAHVNTKNLIGQTPLHIAVMYGHDLVAKALLQKGANLGEADEFGHTPVDVACMHRNVELIHALANTLTYNPNNRKKITGDLGDYDPEQPSVWCHAYTKGEYDLTKLHAIQDYAPPQKGLTEGGWKPSTKAELTPDHRCDIDVRTNIKSEEFIKNYLSINKPVLIKNSLTDKYWKQSFMSLSKDNLLRTYGDAQLHYQNLVTRSGTRPTLHDFVDMMDNHHYKSDKDSYNAPGLLYPLNHPMEHDKIQEIKLSYAAPPFLESYDHHLITGPPTFVLGAANYSSHLHALVPTLDVSVYGRKEVFVFPPSIDFFSGDSFTKWFYEILPKLPPDETPWQCTLEQGDILFIPPLYGYGFVARAEMVSFLGEFQWDRKEEYKNFPKGHEAVRSAQQREREKIEREHHLKRQ